jgi:hypothetical protein
MEIFSKGGVTATMDAAGPANGFPMVTPVIHIKTLRYIDGVPFSGGIFIPKEEVGEVASALLAFVTKSEKREEVKPAVGQIWTPIDKRERGRTIEITSLEPNEGGEPYAICFSRRAGSAKGRLIRILLRRFTIRAGDYRLVTNLEPAKA